MDIAFGAIVVTTRVGRHDLLWGVSHRLHLFIRLVPSSRHSSIGRQQSPGEDEAGLLTRDRGRFVSCQGESAECWQAERAARDSCCWCLNRSVNGKKCLEHVLMTHFFLSRFSSVVADGLYIIARNRRNLSHKRSNLRVCSCLVHLWGSVDVIIMP